MTVEAVPRLFPRYAQAIRALPSGTLTRQQMLAPAFLIEVEGALAMYYAPLEYVNEAAKVVLVGITPGFTQMAIAFQQARDLLHRGQTPDEICREAKRSAAFAGSMRKNLVDMLDGLQVHRHLGVPTCAALFERDHRHLVQTTSAIRFPVFRDGENYTGSRPPIGQSPLLQRTVASVLADELGRIPQALVIPLGKSVVEALQLLASRGELDLARCLIGFPHPSGANGHREREYAERHVALQAQVAQWFADNRQQQHEHARTPAVAAERVGQQS